MADDSEPGQRYLGLMSGTSMDGIDAALFEFGDRQCKTLATHAHAYTNELQRQLLDLRSNPKAYSVDDLGRLDASVGLAFRDAALELLASAGITAAGVHAIGSHGQTIRHRPNDDPPFTLQIGDPNLIAQGTGITTVADFRRRDIAAGGQGAPLAPAFHEWLLAGDDETRAVLNLGGFANITVLPAGGGQVTGFDTGPANSLMDAWIQTHLARAFDADGAWAASGEVSDELLKRLLADDYFALPPPKSTGFEVFHLDWLTPRLAGLALQPADVQATLLELTARTVKDAMDVAAPQAQRVFVCGGGTHNAALMQRLTELLRPIPVEPVTRHGLDPDWVEAAAFAWLASQTLAGLPGNRPSVSGASSREILGAVYLCAS